MTGPIVLPNYGEQFAEALKSLGGSIAGIANPRGPEREAFRKAAAANPAILQNLRDLAEIQGYEQTFTAIHRFVPQDLLDVITNLEPSPEARIRKAGMRGIEQASPETQQALGVADILKLPPLEAARQLALAPAVSKVAGLTPGEVGTTLAERGASRFLSGESPEEGAGGVIQGDLIRLAGSYLARLPPDRLAQLGAYQAMPTLMADEHFMKQLALQEEMFRARNRDRISDMMARLHEQNIIWWQQTTGTGTTDGWEAFFSDQGRKRLEALSGEDPRKPVTSLTPQDRELLDIQRAFQAAPAQKRALDLNRVDSGIARLNAAIDKESDASVRAGLIVALNQQLMNKARINGSAPIHAAWAPGELARKNEGAPGLEGDVAAILGHFKKLRFYDEKNNEVSPETIDALSLTEPTNQRGIVPGGVAAPQTPAPVAPSAPQDTTVARAQGRALELQAQGTREGKTGVALRNWILMKMRQEGYNVQ